MSISDSLAAEREPSDLGWLILNEVRAWTTSSEKEPPRKWAGWAKISKAISASPDGKDFRKMSREFNRVLKRLEDDRINSENVAPIERAYVIVRNLGIEYLKQLVNNGFSLMLPQTVIENCVAAESDLINDVLLQAAHREIRESIESEKLREQAKAQAEIEAKAKRNTGEIIGTDSIDEKERKDHPAFSKNRAILLLLSLQSPLFNNATRDAKAVILNFLTGFGAKSARKEFSYALRPPEKQTTGQKDDAEVVEELLEVLRWGVKKVK